MKCEVKVDMTRAAAAEWPDLTSTYLGCIHLGALFYRIQKKHPIIFVLGVDKKDFRNVGVVD